MPFRPAIAGAHAAARTRWPEITVELTRFADELIRRLDGEPTDDQLAALCTDDVYLAIACLDGDTAAVQLLERDYLTEVDRAGHKLRATDDQTSEVRSHIRHLLFTDAPGRARALAEFTGRGDLRGYLRVIATRELIRAINRGRREQPIEPLLDQLDPANDLARSPELGVLHARYGEQISDALRAAIEALDDRQRSLLRYSLVSGWSIDRIGELYGVHRATAARWLTAARDALGDLIRREVSARLAIPLDDVDSIVRGVQSKIDVSLLRIL